MNGRRRRKSRRRLPLMTGNDDMKYLLGIDVGTTGTKTILFSDAASPIKRAYRSYPLYHEKPGYSEQDAEDWWRAIVDTVREVLEEIPPEDVAAISLSTQGGTLVPTDSCGTPTRRAFVWNDIRFTDEREAFLREVGGSDKLYQITGWSLGRGMPLLAARYLRDKEPCVLARSAFLLTVPSFISMRMTGIAATDPSNAGIEQFTDIRKTKYDAELLRFAGIDTDRLASIRPSGEVIGSLTAKAADALGLTTDTLLVAGAHDQYAVALGAGAVADGDILIGSGTSWVVTAIREHPDFASGLAQSHAAAPDLWGSLRSLSTGGVCLDWLQKNIAKATDDGEIDYSTLDLCTKDLRAAEDGLMFFPFKGISDNGKTFTRASFTGLDLSHSRYHLARAVMEGVVFQVMWMLESFSTKPSANGIKLAGGASRSPVWAKILADAMGLPVKIPAIADLSCVGAAILAGVGVGVFASVEEGYSRFSLRERVLEPNAARTAIYRPLFEKYKKMATALGAAYESLDAEKRSNQ